MVSVSVIDLVKLVGDSIEGLFCVVIGVDNMNFIFICVKMNFC